ncbi:hypothetical protein E5163_08570 [Marinicauda algicola]|uniref:Uncharacterized protein n=1 Tax=Marinicauda algicola TaxID=2029849 RepID=A0A4S2H0Z1_9PROT|nr:hypothetical protein [Marinicauda algicola]TGY89166.1 hypothetical protein E5163_08570 [Marinicauda algicola]
MKHNKSTLPPPRVIVMLVGIAVLLGALFAILMNSWIGGAAVGVAFALAFAGVLFMARRGEKKVLKKRR